MKATKDLFLSIIFLALMLIFLLIGNVVASVLGITSLVVAMYFWYRFAAPLTGITRHQH